MDERFDRSPRLVEKKKSYQYVKDFTPEVLTNIQNNRVYFKGKKDQESNGAIKPFFVNGCGSQKYKQHSQKELLPAVQRLQKHENWIFVRDNAPSHRSNLRKDFLQGALNSHFIKTHEWLPCHLIAITSIIISGIK